MTQLRIALVVETMDTGVGQLVSLLARGLDERGHEVHLLHSIRRTDRAILDQLSARSRVRCVPIDMVRAVKVKDFAAGAEVRRYLKKNGPFDIVHGHSSKGGALARLFAIGFPGARIYTPHAFYTLSPGLSAVPRFVYGTAERALARLCSAVVCGSKVEKRHAESLGIAPERIAIIHNAVAPPALSAPARNRFGFRGDKLIVGFVGRLEYQKAPDVLLRAIAMAADKAPVVRAVMIGGGGLEPSLKELAAGLGIADRVAWLGRQPSARYLSSFDMLAMPSRYEGSSLMPLEAMHARLPILCTPVGGVEETVADGVTGLIVPIDDCEALAAAIVTLARDPARRRAMGAAAQRLAQSFLPEHMVSATEQLYFAALDAKDRRAGAFPDHRRAGARVGRTEPEYAP